MPRGVTGNSGAFGAFVQGSNPCVAEPKLARASNQLQLLDVTPRYPIESNAAARNAYGSAAQEIVCAALKLRPIPINGQCDICFDAEDSDFFYEIKSCHRSGK